MAITKVSRGLLSTGVSDSSDATAITIDSSENVGIGETSPLAKLHIKLGDSGLSSLNAAGNHIFLENTGSNGTGITLASGNTANGSIIFGDEDSNYRGVLIYDHSADAMKFVTAATERMRIASSGNVAIGSTNNGVGGTIDLSVGSTSSSGGITLWSPTNGTHSLGFGDGTSGTDRYRGYVEYAHDGDSMRFATASTERMRIDSSGNVGIGTTPAAELHVNKTNAGGLGGRLLIQNTSSNSGTFCQLILAPTAATAADRCAVIQAENTDGNNNQAMVFKTSAGDSPAERVRIRPYGDLLVGTTSAAQNSGAGVKLNNDGGQGRCFVVGSGSGAEGFSLHDGSAYKFFVTYSGVINATTTTVSGISDERLKENIKDLDQGLADILKLKPRTFDWKEGEGTGKKNVSGFIAQEAETAGFGEFVGDWKHDTLSDAKSFGQAGLIPALVKAIQEQQTQIEALQSEINTLKGGD